MTTKGGGGGSDARTDTGQRLAQTIHELILETCRLNSLLKP